VFLNINLDALLLLKFDFKNINFKKIKIMSIEDIYVKDVYNSIANEFSDTRYRPWTCVESFLDNLEKDEIIGDIGCGNGKNMLYRKDLINYGCDFSKELVKICLKQNLNVIEGDILNIPYKDNSFDYTLCIAVIHHLSTIDKRIKSINELIRVTKPGGKILILVWALEQESNSKRKFTKQENYVDWKNKSKQLLGKRYYYVFKKNELENLVSSINIKIVESFYEKGNHGVILEKIY
jgi:SAM-dependent methyltransferase